MALSPCYRYDGRWDERVTANQTVNLQREEKPDVPDMFYVRLRMLTLVTGSSQTLITNLVSNRIVSMWVT